MSTVGASDFDEVIERNHRAVDKFAKGNNKPLEDLYSRRDDVSLGNPFGPFVRGFEAVAKTMERAATLYGDGRAVGFDSIAKVAAEDMAFHRRGRANRGEDRGTPGPDARVPSVPQCLPSRRWRVETGPPPRRPDNGAPGCGVRHREGSIRLAAAR